MPARPPPLPFDEVALLYDEARPGYSPEIVQTVLSLANLPPDAWILEIGAGTGQLTLPLASSGYPILALEPGPSLARLCAFNCRLCSNVEVRPLRFEDYPAIEPTFDLIASAQAFHWIPPAQGFAKASALLKPGGALALLWNLDLSEETPFYRAVQPIYDKYFPDPRGAASRPVGAAAEDYAARLGDLPCFHTPTILQRRYDRAYPLPTYLKLLQTYSPVIALSPVDRAGFLQEMSNLIQEQGGFVERQHETFLVVALKR